MEEGGTEGEGEENVGNSTGNRRQDGMDSTTLRTADHSTAENWRSTDWADELADDEGGDGDGGDDDDDNASCGDYHGYNDDQHGAADENAAGNNGGAQDTVDNCEFADEDSESLAMVPYNSISWADDSKASLAIIPDGKT
jgi:hypothetical protein